MVKKSYVGFLTDNFQMKKYTTKENYQNRAWWISTCVWNRVKIFEETRNRVCVWALEKGVQGGHIFVNAVHQLRANKFQNCGLWVSWNTVWRFQNIKNVDLQFPPAPLMCILVLELMSFSLCLFPENGNSKFFIYFVSKYLCLILEIFGDQSLK